MVTPAARREAVAHLRLAFEASERRACSTLGADRTSIRYRSMRPDDAAVRAPARTGRHSPTVRRSATACPAQTRRHHHKPQEAATALPRGTIAGATPRRTQASLGYQGSDDAAARTQP